MNISAKFQLHPPTASEVKFFTFYFANLAFWLPWKQIKLTGLDNMHMVGRELLTETFL